MITVATALPSSSRCRHCRRRRYSCWRARLPEPASSAGELACQQLLAIAAAGLPSQPSPPPRLARPRPQVAGKQILLGSPAHPCLRCVSKPLTLFPHTHTRHTHTGQRRGSRQFKAKRGSCSPSVQRCRQADSPWQPRPPLPQPWQVTNSPATPQPYHPPSLLPYLCRYSTVIQVSCPGSPSAT